MDNEHLMSVRAILPGLFTGCVSNISSLQHVSTIQDDFAQTLEDAKEMNIFMLFDILVEKTQSVVPPDRRLVILRGIAVALVNKMAIIVMVIHISHIDCLRGFLRPLANHSIFSRLCMEQTLNR